MIVEVVWFDDELVCLVKQQNDWTGNYITSVRQIRGGYGEEFIRFEGRKIDVSYECDKARKGREELSRLRKAEKEF